MSTMLSLEVTAALAALGAARQAFDQGAVAGDCDCGMAELPTPQIMDNGARVMPKGWRPPTALLRDDRLMRLAVARGCVSEIYSERITIAAGATVQVDVEPSHGCFITLARKVVAVSAADPQLRQRVAVAREFVGDCPISCQNESAFSDFMDTDDCKWCVMRQVPAGRTDDNEQYHVSITNLGAAGDIIVQVGVRGICYAGTGCWAGWGGSSPGCGACAV
jgi:hypothetical protein